MSQKKKPAQEDLSNLSVRRRQEAAEAQQAAKRKRIYIIIGIVVAVLVAALLVWDSGIVQRSAAAYKVGNYGFSVSDVDYYYHNQYNQFAPNASYYGLDTSKPLDEQPYDETKSWQDFLMESAKSSMNEIALLCTEARANGYTLSEDGVKAVQDSVDSVRSSAESYGMDVNSYLHYGYGRFMNLSAYEHVVSEYQLAIEYASYLQDNYDITDADLQAYYDEHANELDTFDYEAYYFSLGLTPEYDDQGNQKDYDPDELSAAQTVASAKADSLKEVMSTASREELEAKAEELGATAMNDLNGSSLSYYPFGEWLTDSSRAAGDTDVIEDSSTDSTGNPYVNGYYVVRFNSRTLDEYHGADFYNLLVQAQTVESTDEAAEPQYDWDAAKAKADALEADWKSNGGDAESFLAMAEENTDGSTTKYTNVSKGSQNDEVDTWLFGEEHSAGDYAMIKDETLHGYRMVYFTGYQDLAYWQSVARQSLASEQYTTWVEGEKEALSTSETFLMREVG